MKLKGINLFKGSIATALSVIVLYIGVTAILWSLKVYTPLNGVSKVFASEADVVNQFTRENDVFNIQNGDKTYTLPIKDFANVSPSVNSMSYIEYVSGTVPKVTYNWAFSDDKLRKELKKFYKKCVNAKIAFNEDTGKFSLKPEQVNCDFDVNIVTKDVEATINAGKFKLNLAGYLRQPKVAKESLQSKFDKVSWVNDWDVCYTNGTHINAAYLAPYWNKRNLDIDSIDFSQVINALKADYDTGDKSITFKTHSGKKRKVQYNTYGKHIYQDKEIAFLKEALKEHKSYSNLTPATYGFDTTIDKEYVEVSIGEQHVWHYKGKKVVSDSACVTGCVSKGRGTPKGVFYVSEKIPGKNLKGDNYVTWVNRWMRITNGGVGFHDAYWRGNFGGNIYISNGSHGCINLPKSYAYQLYDEISTGTPVVIY